MKVLQRLCYFCNEDGENVQATHTYKTTDGVALDVCDKHLKAVKEAKLDFRKLNEEEIVTQVEDRGVW